MKMLLLLRCWLFGRHEWIVKTEPDRIYLKCIECWHETPGLVIKKRG